MKRLETQFKFDQKSSWEHIMIIKPFFTEARAGGDIGKPL